MVGHTNLDLKPLTWSQTKINPPVKKFFDGVFSLVARINWRNSCRNLELYVRARHCTTTVAPSLVRLYKSTMSSFDKRMHPDETPPPSFHGSFVPWIR